MPMLHTSHFKSYFQKYKKCFGPFAGAMSSSNEPTAKRARAGPDLKIVVDDGELEVHSLILELASPVFAKMLNSAMKEGSQTSITLPGKSKSELEAFYNSLHPGIDQPLTKESAMFLAQWADEYQTDVLKKQCDDFLVAHVAVDAAALQHSVMCNLKKRTQQCVDQMKDKFEHHLNDLRILFEKDCQEHLAQLWPLILQKAGIQDFPMPPPSHLASTWPFLEKAVTSAPKANRLEARLDVLQRDMHTWPREIFHHLPASDQADREGFLWLYERLKSRGISMIG